MKSIEKKTVKNFKNNLEFFSKKHPRIFEKLMLLEAAISTGQYKEKYALEYQNKYFDIMDIDNNKYLYNQNSNIASKALAKTVNLNKTENVIEGFYSAMNNTSEQQAIAFHRSTEVVTDYRYASSMIIYHMNQIAPKESTTLKQLVKYIYFGVGIGKHLELIQKNIVAQAVLIVEDNIEIFRLSCFTIDYEEIFKNNELFFAISETKDDFQFIFKEYLEVKYHHSHYMKYTLLSDNYIDRIKEIQAAVITQNHYAFPYSIRLALTLKTPLPLVHGYNYLNISKNIEGGFLSDKPILLLAAGPSLGNNMAWLKKNKDRFVIVCILATLRTLYTHDIEPDIVVNMDSGIICLDFFEGVSDTFLAKPIFIFASMVHKEVVDKVPKENLYFWETERGYKVDFGDLMTPSVGEVAYALLIILGASKLYLLGLDLALDPISHEKYTNKEIQTSRGLNNPQQTNKYGAELHKDETNIKGNFLESVPTLVLFKLSVDSFNLFTKTRKKKNQKVYNLGNGAYLEDTIPLHIKDISLESMPRIDKKSSDYRDGLNDFLNRNSENVPNINDIENFNLLIKEGVRLETIVQAYKKDTSSKTIEECTQKLGTLMNELTIDRHNGYYQINNIMSLYIRLISPYFIDLLFTKEVINPMQNFTYLNDILISQIEKMLKVYRSSLNVYKSAAEFLFYNKNI